MGLGEEPFGADREEDEIFLLKTDLQLWTKRLWDFTPTTTN